jgi:hypothetical protein
MDIVKWLPLLVSGAAFAVSTVALWKTHFAPGKVIVAGGSLRLHIYPITNEGRNWFMSSFDLPLSFTNAGAQPLLVTGVRLRLHFPDLPIDGNCEYMNAKWEIDPARYQEIGRNRFTWIKKLVRGEAMPFPMLGKQTVTKHLIFESRWDTPVVQKRVECRLEVRTAHNEAWQRTETWSLSLAATVWADLTTLGCGLAFCPDSSPLRDKCVFPDNLHDFTGSKDPIPKALPIASSFLGFPKEPTL